MHVNKPHHSVQKPQAVALSSQEAQWARLALTTNNLANSTTPGFKGQMIKLTNTTQKGKTGRVVHFVSADKSLRNTADGSCRPTGNPLDVALRGDGFFIVETSKGIRLTRNGQLALNDAGELVTASGSYKILSHDKSPIVIPKLTKSIIIHPHGGVYADNKQVGKIGVFTVKNKQEHLRNTGDNLLDPLTQPLSESTHYYIKQSSLEDSNVSSVKESLLLIEILRQFEHSQKVIEEQDQNSRKTLNVSTKNV